jgi:hypothetical protein
MAEESAHERRGLEHWSIHDHDTVTRMTQARPEEAQIASDEGGAPDPVEVAQDLFLVLPLGAAGCVADLASPDTPGAQAGDLIPWNVLVEGDHAAGREPTSRTTPRRVRTRAFLSRGDAVPFSNSMVWDTN